MVTTQCFPMRGTSTSASLQMKPMGEVTQLVQLSPATSSFLWPWAVPLWLSFPSVKRCIMVLLWGFVNTWVFATLFLATTWLNHNWTQIQLILLSQAVALTMVSNLWRVYISLCVIWIKMSPGHFNSGNKFSPSLYEGQWLAHNGNDQHLLN